MPVVITIDDNLAARLRPQAEAHNVSVEKYALQVVAQAAANGDDEHWHTCNGRRIALIHKQFATGLTPDEETELAGLQNMADLHLEEMDNRMLDDVHRLRTKVEQIVQRPSA